MVAQMIYLRDWDWLCEVFYEVKPKDAEVVLGELRAIGCKGENYSNASESVTSGKPNRGVTYSNFTKRSSVVMLTWTTSADEFHNTLDHEKNHLVRQIGTPLGIDPWGEEEGYLRGEIAQKMFSVAKHFLCGHCRKQKRERR